MIGALAFLLLFTVPTRPAQPTIGDLVTIDFSQQGNAVFLDPLPPGVELVSKNETRITLRVFTTGTIRLGGVVNRGDHAIRFRNLPIEVKSVLRADDDLKPAPLVPPRPLPAQRLPWLMIAAAALLAAGAWMFLLTGRRGVAARAKIVEDELLALLRSWPSEGVDDAFLAQLSDATKRYVSSRDPRVAESMTTREILSRLGDERAAGALADILQVGDQAKFAPWGAGTVDASLLREEAKTVAEERRSA